MLLVMTHRGVESKERIFSVQAESSPKIFEIAPSTPTATPRPCVFLAKLPSIDFGQFRQKAQTGIASAKLGLILQDVDRAAGDFILGSALLVALDF